MSDLDTFAYAVSKEGQPGAFAVSVDKPDRKQEIAKFISKEIRLGHNVQRVTVEQAKAMLLEWLKWKEKFRNQA